MNDEPERYSEEEVGLILRRAAEIQAGRSLTLPELEAAASEAGIDGALVRRAAVEVRTRRSTDELQLHGVFGQTQLVYERTVAGLVGPGDWDELVAEIRRQLGGHGIVESLGKELVWRSQKLSGEAGRDIRVSVFARRTHTVIRVEERTGALAGGLYGGIMGGGFGVGVAWIVPVLIAAVGVPQLIPVLLALWVGALWYLARSIQRSVLRSRHEQLTALADGLEDVCRDLAKDQ
jgi:hypothetical protein